MKMMDALRHLEGGIRERLQATVQRGKVEVWIFVETLSDARTQRLDTAALAQWLQALAAANSGNALDQPA